MIKSLIAVQSYDDSDYSVEGDTLNLVCDAEGLRPTDVLTNTVVDLLGLFQRCGMRFVGFYHVYKDELFAKHSATYTESEEMVGFVRVCDLVIEVGFFLDVF